MIDGSEKREPDLLGYMLCITKNEVSILPLDTRIESLGNVDLHIKFANIALKLHKFCQSFFEIALISNDRIMKPQIKQAIIILINNKQL